PRSIALVQQYAPELEKRCRPHLKATTDSWKVDEPYIKVRQNWMHLYRAVDSEDNTSSVSLEPDSRCRGSHTLLCQIAATHCVFRFSSASGRRAGGPAHCG